MVVFKGNEATFSSVPDPAVIGDKLIFPTNCPLDSTLKVVAL